MKRLKLYIMATRPPFFTASIVPVLLGTAMAWAWYGKFSLVDFLLTLVGVIALHAGANASNDYYDWKNGTDRYNKTFAFPFTGGSRMIPNGLISPEEMKGIFMVAYLIALAMGIILFIRHGYIVLILGFIGLLSGYFYTATPLFLAGKGVGEILIGLNFGILITLGAFFVQTDFLSWTPVIASIPVSLLITLVLWINQFQDSEADKKAGKVHLVARLGLNRAAQIYIILLYLSYLSVIIGILAKALPVCSLIVFVTLPVAIKTQKIVKNNYNRFRELTPANAATIKLHLNIGLLLAVSFIIDKIL